MMMNTNSKIFVWNCRGAANTSFYRFCKQYVCCNKPGMIVIVEIRCDPNKLSKTLNMLGYEDYVASEGQGFAGGIIVA
jgi:hypothetical protein